MASKGCGGRRNQKAKVDRISDLPDELISQILSLLPTKTAVGTSILSNRWKYLWTNITSFHFTSRNEEVKAFMNFVDTIFHSCKSPNIQKVTMHVPTQCPNINLECWIYEARKRNVLEVDIHVSKFPLTLFSCKTLTVLKLSGCVSYDPEIYSFDLPCLRVLHINQEYCAEGSMEKLISSCPVVEDLTLSGSLGYDKKVNMFMVCAPTLKSLRLQLNGYGNREISVKSPNLECLHLSKYFVKYKIKGDFSSLVKTNVNIGDIRLSSRYDPFHPEKRDLLPYGFTLPKFDNLKCLEVTTCHYLFWVMLPKLIRISPSLEVLSIKQRGHDMPPYDFTWVGPKLVPTCMRFNLSTIKIEGFNGRKHEIELLRYLLGNSKVLKSLIINCQGLTHAEKMEFFRQLVQTPKASICHIQFPGDLI